MTIPRLDDIRIRIEEMESDLRREVYATRAGLRVGSQLRAILDRHRDPLATETIAAVEERLGAAAGDVDEARRLRLLREGLAARRETLIVSRVDDRLSDLEATLTVEVGGEVIPFRQLNGRIRGEANRERRRALHRARLEAIAGPLGPLHRERIELARTVAADLGHLDYVAFVADTSGIDLLDLDRQVAPILERTSGRHRDLLRSLLRRTTGLTLADAESHDVQALFRAPAFDVRFPAGGEVAAARQVIERGLGLDLTAGGRIRLDLEPRPGKSPRAFCVPVRVPDEIVLVVKPAGGIEDYRSFFHELGHALHFAYTDSAQPMEYRRFGDSSVTEGYAVFLDGLLHERAWIERHLGNDLEPYLEHAAFRDLWMYRRHAAKLAYELELWRTPASAIEGMAGRYAQHLGGAALVPVDPASFLADLDLHFYVARYLRAWMLAAVLRARLRSDFGDAWFESRRAGRFLRELWSYGQKLDAVELARELGRDTLNAGPLIGEVEALVG
jgi:hypothetical protein